MPARMTTFIDSCRRVSGELSDRVRALAADHMMHLSSTSAVLGTDNIGEYKYSGSVRGCSKTFDLMYRTAWRSCIDLHAIAATRLKTTSYMVRGFESSNKTLL